MAKASASAQHYLECDECEENPAKFLCKTCEGHLCELCKIKHEKRKITRNHEILSLYSKNEDLLDLISCPKHTKKKLECYCTPCSEPVCTDCIMQSHNGHLVKPLAIVYKQFKDYSKQQKEKIENVLLPSHRDFLAKTKERRSAFRKKADEMQEKIDVHTQRMVEIVKNVGQQTVVNLRKAENEGLEKMDTFIDTLEEKIDKLQLLSEKISATFTAKPQPTTFLSIENDDLKSFQTTPISVEYTLTDFQPQNMNIENMFGKSPVLETRTSHGITYPISRPASYDVDDRGRREKLHVDISRPASYDVDGRGHREKSHVDISRPASYDVDGRGRREKSHVDISRPASYDVDGSGRREKSHVDV